MRNASVNSGWRPDRVRMWSSFQARDLPSSGLSPGRPPLSPSPSPPRLSNATLQTPRSCAFLRARCERINARKAPAHQTPDGRHAPAGIKSSGPAETFASVPMGFWIRSARSIDRSLERASWRARCRPWHYFIKSFCRTHYLHLARAFRRALLFGENPARASGLSGAICSFESGATSEAQAAIAADHNVEVDD